MKKLILFYSLALLAFNLSAQDTTRIYSVDTLVISKIDTLILKGTETTIVTAAPITSASPVEVLSRTLSNEQFGAYPDDGIDDSKAFELMFNSERAAQDQVFIIHAGVYTFDRPVNITRRIYDGTVYVEARGAYFNFKLKTGEALFNFTDGENDMSAVSNLVMWNGGRFEAGNKEGNVFEMVGSYGAKFENIRMVSFADTAFVGSFLLGCEFDRWRFYNVGLGFYIDAVEDDQNRASTNIIISNCRYYAGAGQKDNGFAHFSKGYQIKIRDNIVEGHFIARPLKFDFQFSGVSKNAIIEGNHFEVFNYAIVTFTGANAADIYFEHNYCSEEASGLIIDAFETPLSDHTTFQVYINSNFIGSNDAKFNAGATGVGQWHFENMYFKPRRSSFTGGVPYWTREKNWSFLKLSE